MKREEVRKELLEIHKTYNNILVELPTGFGKTKIALDLLKHTKFPTKTGRQVLIVVPRIVLIDEWKKEITKWKMNLKSIEYTFTTYVSFPKSKLNQTWDVVIFDEAHHLTSNCREAIDNRMIYNSFLLSATVKDSLKEEMNKSFDHLYQYKIETKEAIDGGILPDPKVFLIPLSLNAEVPTESIYKNTKGKDPMIETNWFNRWKFIRQKKFKVRIYCTEKQYLEDLNSQIEWYKRKALASRNEFIKNRWLKLAGDRLKWLSSKKIPYIKLLLDQLDKERTLTFCNNIEQTEELGKYCINSKNKKSEDNLLNFNKGKINHITACNILNEGANLVNCRVGIYANLNSSEIIIKQRLGRILRHKDPIIIIPFYKDTREEELVKIMLEDYNQDLIIVEENINNLKF